MKVNLSKIKGLMAEHGDTQSALAAKLEISENTLRNYLKGVTAMRVDTVGRIAAIYDVPALELLAVEQG